MMSRKAIIILPLVLILLLVGVGIAYVNGFFPGSGSGIGYVKNAQENPIVKNNQSTNTNVPNNEQIIEEEKTGPAVYRIEEVASGLEVPWSIVFTGSDRILFTERAGRVRAIENGKLVEKSLVEFPEVSQRSEDGLMGMTLDPDYQNNKLVYLSLAYNKAGKAILKVVKMKDSGTVLTEEAVILDNIPVAQYHAGSRLKFDKQGKLLITMGDGLQKEEAQNLESNLGKLLRINSDGSIPADNPFEGSPVWAYGLRNPQGFDWHPESGDLYLVDHGPSGMDGPGGGDEINLIEKGANYGWPVISHEKSAEGMKSPLKSYTPAIAPASATFVSSAKYPALENSLLVGMLRGEGILRLKFDPNDPSKIIEEERLEIGDLGRIREIVQAPNFGGILAGITEGQSGSGGEIYFSTSNRDGRGSVRSGDDKIYRLIEE
jgi:aldose sugar dehydrogenase